MADPKTLGTASTSSSGGSTDAPSPARQTPGEQQAATTPPTVPASAPPVTSATAAGEDGTPRILSVGGMQDQFGPVSIVDDNGQPVLDDDGNDVSYTLTRAGVEVDGPHVKQVRDCAAAHHVPLRSAKPDTK